MLTDLNNQMGQMIQQLLHFQHKTKTKTFPVLKVDASILITANVPSAKKIIIHGPQEPDDGAIPSQFPISEDVQFCQLQHEATDFFGIEEERMNEFYLVDNKTRKMDAKSCA